MRSPSWTWDELLLACALVVRNGWRELRVGDPSVTELSDLLRALPLPDRTGLADSLPEYRSAGSVSRKTTDLASNHPGYPGRPTKGGKLDKLIIKEFLAREAAMLQAADAIETGISSGQLALIPEQPDEADEDGTTAAEGRLLARWAISRERNPALRKGKIAQVRKLGLPLRCAVCAFDFRSAYGTLGDGYIEVHHLLPLHISGPRETKLNDLALLCANCHRMCHRSHHGASWRTPGELRTEMERSRSRG
ncbi:HNH endonuclease [Streptomyces yangpuensis]|uniref:HNH endonuclease n=1 Tax=Streptomyces yangpuensis TaxID=1648182 RepID=A0ABY5PWK0_9ACTN|nr:HNH endonuclease [Streptomyces yangpuensis]UUY48008.1 HNH endonuclease [Streptomyces yangpuensis]